MHGKLSITPDSSVSKSFKYYIIHSAIFRMQNTRDISINIVSNICQLKIQDLVNRKIKYWTLSRGDIFSFCHGCSMLPSPIIPKDLTPENYRIRISSEGKRRVEILGPYIASIEFSRKNNFRVVDMSV